jgi:hypothetical protein
MYARYKDLMASAALPDLWGLKPEAMQSWRVFYGTKKKTNSQAVDLYLLYGSACWARTSDPLINSQLLYQLS